MRTPEAAASPVCHWVPAHVDQYGLGARSQVPVDRKWALGLQVCSWLHILLVPHHKLVWMEHTIRYLFRLKICFLVLDEYSLPLHTQIDNHSVTMLFWTVPCTSSWNHEWSFESSSRTQCVLEEDWSLQHEMSMGSWFCWWSEYYGQQSAALRRWIQHHWGWLCHDFTHCHQIWTSGKLQTYTYIWINKIPRRKKTNCPVRFGKDMNRLTILHS